MTGSAAKAFRQTEQSPMGENEPMSLEAKVVHAVSLATKKVFGVYAIPTEMQDPQEWNPQNTLDADIVSLIDIESPWFHGYLGVALSKGSFLELVSKMLQEPQTEITSDNRDAAGEINNIILGNSKPELSTLRVSMTLPRVLPEGMPSLPYPSGANGMQIPCSTSTGTFSLIVVSYPPQTA